MKKRSPAKKKGKKKAKKPAVKKPKGQTKAKKTKKPKKPAKPKKPKGPIKRKQMSFKKAVKKGIILKPTSAFQWLSSDNPRGFFEHFNRMLDMTGELDATEVMTAMAKSLAT